MTKASSKTENVQMSVIGSLLLRPALYADVAFLRPVMFSGRLRPAADFIWSQSEEGAGFGISMVSDAAGWSAKFKNEVLSAAEPAVIEEQAYIIRDAYLAAERIKIEGKTIDRLVSGENYWDVDSEVSAEIELLHSYANEEVDTKADVTRDCYEEVLQAMNGSGPSGITTGYKKIDRWIGGWYPGNMIIIAARPGMGKTTIVLQHAKAAARSGAGVAFFSFEMTERELVDKWACLEAGIRPRDKRNGHITAGQADVYAQALSEYLELPIHIIDQVKSAPTLANIRDRCRQLVDRYGVRLIIIDYVQLMEPPQRTGNENYEVQQISRGLKRIASQLGVPIIAVSQLNRGAETRGGAKKPLMSDLRSSGSLEQDANLIVLLYRPEYYKIMEDEEGNSLAGVLEYEITKDRVGGDPETFRLHWSQIGYVEYDPRAAAPQPAQPVISVKSFSIPATSRPGSDDDIPF